MGFVQIYFDNTENTLKEAALVAYPVSAMFLDVSVREKQRLIDQATMDIHSWDLYQ